MSSADQEAVSKSFHDVALQLLQASVAAWPEDPLLPIAVAQFQRLDHGTALEGFKEHFGRHVEGFRKRDTEALFEAAKDPLVAAVDIETKFRNSNANTQDTLWTYLGHLCRYVTMGDLYKYIPTPVMGAVTEAAEDLKKQLDAGSVDIMSINPFELGQQVMSRFKADELENMMTSMMTNPDAMNAMMTQMTSLLGPGGGGLGGGGIPNMSEFVTAAMGPNGTGTDLSSLMKLMGPPPKK